MKNQILKTDNNHVISFNRFEKLTQKTIIENNDFVKIVKEKQNER